MYIRPGNLRDANPSPPRGRPDPVCRLAPLFFLPVSLSLSLPQAVARSRREQNRNLRNCDAHPSPVCIAKTAVTIRPSRGPGHPVVLRRLPLCLCPSRLIPTVSYKGDRWKFCSDAREGTSPSHSGAQIKMRLDASAMPISYIHASVSALGTGARGVISDAGNRDSAPRNVDQRECKKTRERER